MPPGAWRDTSAVGETENVRRVRETIEAFNQGDHDRILGGLDHDFELRRAAQSPDSDEVIRGPDAFRRWLQPDAFESMRLDVEEITEGSGKVLVDGWVRGVGQGSGVEITQRAYVVYTISGERIAAMEVFFDAAEARRAAGLEGA
jgi:ketosteroid isomerase-like protein